MGEISGSNYLEAEGTDDVVIAGNGDQTLAAYGTNDTLIAGSGSDILTNAGTGGFYQFGLGATNATITNGSATNTAASNELDFTGGVSDNQLWFKQVGNDLQIDLMGTNSDVTVAGWFSSTGNQLAEITAGGMKIDNDVAQLVQAMATYSAANPGFNPTASGVTQAPNDAGLQSAIANAWH